MSQTSLDIRQSQTRVLQDQIDSAAVTQMDSVLASINNELTPPGRLIAAATPSLVVTVGTGTVVNPNTSKNRLIPFISNTYVNFAGGTITFPSGTGTITVSPGVNLAITIGASQFLAITVQLDATGNINLSAGTASGTLSGALAAASPGSSSFLSLGLIVIQTNGSSVIQNITNAMLYQFGSGTGGSGSGGSGLGDDITSLQFQADILDTFPESPTASTTTIDNSAGKTNASYNAGKNMYQISYDASKTGTSTGTAFTLSATPGYTVVAGDVVVNQVTGEVKKITVVTTQTSYTLESAFASNLAATAVTVSQAVHTKDVYNLAVDSNGNTLASAFAGATFSEIAVFYKDNSTSGSNQWADTAINCGYTASPDNTNWTTMQVKTIITSASKYGSTILPSAGTSLYIRFFADKTSGSGVVNLIMYKAYMQKLASSAQGGILWAAYGTTNNSTTPVGCTIATTGGTTKITLTGGNQYAVGVNSGQTYGSVDVYLNGQLLPRFVAGSVPATDGYYTEVSGTIIALDRDYSSQQIEVQIVSRTQIVDASTTNTTSISAIQAATNSGFQGFVSQTDFLITATSTAGTPVAGTFYSTISGRSAMSDLSQDLKGRMGVERLITQVSGLQAVQTEFGPNGETVFQPLNDFYNQIRFVGNDWLTNLSLSYFGQMPYTNTSGNYVEITFYGTGLNMLTGLENQAKDIRLSIDGGAEGSNLYPSSSASTILDGRNYAANQVIPLVNGLALGIHTAKVRSNSALSLAFGGFEILNESSSVKVNSGISYIQGQKLSIATQSAFSYSAPVSGTTGGRVLVYQKSDGTIGSAFTACASSPSTLASASHANEEIVRTYAVREFGAGRADDFGGTAGSGTAKAFTLDDGTTTFCGAGGTSLINGIEAFTVSNGINTFSTFTFVGTGLDIMRIDNNSGGADTFTVQIDGGSQLTLSTTGLATLRQQKIVSGLPYGTHVVRFIRTSTPTTYDVYIKQFIVYQPKTPALPSGAVQLGTYNVMANYVTTNTALVTTTQDQGAMASGVLRKVAQRELCYVDGTGGTTSWTTNGPSAQFSQGLELFSDRTNAYMQYTFFGTGFEFRFQSNSTMANVQISLNGSNATTTNFPSMLSAVFGSGGPTFNSSTGILNQSNSGNICGAGVAIYNLPLAVYTVKFNNTGTNLMRVDMLDIITPIHSVKSNVYADYQNTVPVGSNAISDDRQNTPVKNALAANKAWVQVFGVSNGPSTTSTSFVPMPDMSATIRTSGGALQITYSLSANQSGAAQFNKFQLYVDGVAVGSTKFDTHAANGQDHIDSDTLIVPVAAGTHKVDLYWGVGSGTGALEGTSRNMMVREL